MKIESQNMAVQVRGVKFEFSSTRGKAFPVISDITFEVRIGETVAIVGPSGGGKTTLLRLIAGILTPSVGEITVSGVAPRGARGICGYVPQGYSLFPWLTVRENILYGIRAREKAFRREKVAELLAATDLNQFSEVYPNHLSGGMKQRVALARALAIEPKVLLLDEPFSALDLRTRSEVRNYFLKVTENTRTASLIVTHDLQEAAYTSDRILFLGPRPAKIINELEIPFKRPRVRDLMGTREFFEISRGATEIAMAPVEYRSLQPDRS